MKIPVLTYHSTNISGNEYQNNDLVAFQADLILFKQQGIKIISAIDLVKWINGLISLDEKKKYVVITFDDGCELDFYDWKHPVFGGQQSFNTSIKLFDGIIHAASFVIASKKARETLVHTCTAGYEIWGDHWWQEAENSDTI